MQKFTRQQGGTILGIIIGLVIGLGIALAVAVVITRTPTPFTNRLARPEKVLPLTPGELTDPNKPLYGGHAPVKDAIQELLERRDKTAAPTGTVPAQTAGKAPVIELSTRPQQPKAPVAKAAAPAASANAGTTAAAAGTAAADSKWTYYLQVGAFRNKTEAENLRGKLALAGVEASISERQSENGALYRVRTGPFSQREAMNQVRSKLSENGVDTAVVRVARQ